MKRNRTVLGIICIVLGILICFGLAPLFNKVLSSKSEIVRSKTTIPQGTKITTDMIETVNVGSYGLPNEVIIDKDLIVGKYAAAEIFKNDYFLPEKVEPELKNAEHIISTLEGTKWAISVSLSSLASSVSAKLMSGDVVSVIAVDSNSPEGIIYPELQYMEVIAATNTNAVDIDELGVEQEDKTPATVTLLANKKQAEILAKLSTDNTAHMALICRKNNAELKQNLLTAQDTVFTSDDSTENTEQNHDNPQETEVTNTEGAE